VQFGLLISVLFHVAILGGALISIHSRAELRLPVTEPVAVGMIAPGDVTKVKLGTRTAKLLEAAEAKESPEGRQARKESTKPKMAAAAPPPPAASAPAPPKAADPPAPAPVPAAEALKKLEAQQKLEAEQKKAAEQQQKQAEEQRLAEEKKRAEAQDKAEAMRRAEAQKLADEQKRLQEEQQKLADERKRAEEQKLAEERKRAEAEQQRLEEQRKQAEELKKRKDQERRLKIARERKEKQRKAAEAAKKRKLEEEKARQEAEASKKAFDADKIAALLNKEPDKGAPPPPSAKADQPTKAKGPSLGAAEGRDQIISASERAMIGQVIKSCVIPGWTVLSGGASAQETVVKIRLRFNKDGTLSAPPQITNPQGTPYFRAISESALRAVQQCEPYNLPRSLYEHWKDIIMNFSPKDMF
jgi:colicin import membrane protein